MDNFMFFLKEGLFHVLDWNAYDHVLFLIVLVVIYDFKNWQKILWLISLFTIGHTLSLILSAYKIVSINQNWIEFLIPVTILITALVNVFFAKNATKLAKTNTNFIQTVSGNSQNRAGNTSNYNNNITKRQLGINFNLLVYNLEILRFIKTHNFEFNQMKTDENSDL